MVLISGGTIRGNKESWQWSFGFGSKPNGYLFGVGYHKMASLFKRLFGCSPGYRGFDPLPLKKRFVGLVILFSGLILFELMCFDCSDSILSFFLKISCVIRVFPPFCCEVFCGFTEEKWGNMWNILCMVLSRGL